MKKGRAIVLIIIPLMVLLSMNCVLATQNSSLEMTVSVNLIKTAVSAIVNSSIFFGNISKGFESDDVRVDVINTGVTNITITPQLESSDNIFENLYLRKRTTDTPAKIGLFSMNIPKPTTLGGTKSDYFYMKLDLTNFAGSINSNTMGYSKKVIVWILPQE